MGARLLAVVAEGSSAVWLHVLSDFDTDPPS